MIGSFMPGRSPSEAGRIEYITEADNYCLPPISLDISSFFIFHISQPHLLHPKAQLSAKKMFFSAALLIAALPFTMAQSTGQAMVEAVEFARPLAND
jgi:hypothetical protein